MTERYFFEQIEQKWQQHWQTTDQFHTEMDTRPKFYCLVMLPYPSGFLHMGHVRNYTIGDAVAWHRRLNGFNVLQPIGWDSFGQPAEQAAIKQGIQPAVWTEGNIAHMRAQLQRIGISYDWRREIAAHRAEYYRWDQWFFLQIYQRGLIYKRTSPVNWCVQCQTVLSNEQSANRSCWRCKSEVIDKDLAQWSIRISDYAAELLQDIDEISDGWPEAVLTMQRNWIGGSVDEEGKVTYRLRDWNISRQRFWGAPIPIIYCDDCGIVPVPFEQLPVMLPEVAPFTGEGESPLAKVAEFVNTSCPQCQRPAKRETDTMDTFVDSSWYFFRYCDPDNQQMPFDPDKISYWLPVDLYIGGIDQAVMHLIYARVWTKIMRDIGLVKFNEPVKQLLTQGMVTNITPPTGEWKAMSKSIGNGVSPDEMIDKYGADAMRLFVLFAAPPEQELRWSEVGIKGMQRFLWKIFQIAQRWQPSFNAPVISTDDAPDESSNAFGLRRATHNTIKRVDEHFEQLRFNSAIAALMSFTNSINSYQIAPGDASQIDIAAIYEAISALTLMLTPFAPHFCAEVWQMTGHQTEITSAVWPKVDEALISVDRYEIPIQIDGKLRSSINVESSITESELQVIALADEKVRAFIGDREISRVIVKPMQVVNVVLKQSR